MRRVLAIVEGATERAVLQAAVAPWLATRGVSFHPKVVGKPGHKGGIRPFVAVLAEIAALLRQEPNSIVTTFFDYYGMPRTWPGRTNPQGVTPQRRAESVEKAIHAAVAEDAKTGPASHRFISYVQMHELEALLFVNPILTAEVFEQPAKAKQLADVVTKCGGCEAINDQPETSPAERIKDLLGSYRKGAGQRAQAFVVAQRLDLQEARVACPHFGEWLSKLEQLGK